ncbi:MAG: transglycosylase domain-containing protein [Myxococcales bacterium]
MKRLLSFIVLVLILGGLLVPGLYFFYAKDLPDLDSPSAVFKAVKRSVESQRQVVAPTGPTGQKLEAYQFELMPLAKLPAHFVDAIVAVDSCPDYTTSKKDLPYPKLRRIAKRWLRREVAGFGPQACQLRYADQVVLSLGVVDSMRASIGDHKVLDALSVEELLVYRISTVYYGEGVIGPQAAAQKLFKKDLDKLDLGQVAEMVAAEGYFQMFQRCQNPAKLKMYRDAILDRMEAFRLLGQAEAKAARARQVTCFYKPP